MTPLVSIITPVYNRQEFLRETIASVRAQTHQSWELLVMDDASSDASVEVAREIARADSRVVVHVAERNSGAPARRNEGVAKSRGEYVIFLDSDDLLATKALEQRAAFMQKHPQLDFAVFDCLLFRETAGDVNVVWNVDSGEDDIARLLKLDVPWQTSGPFWKREALSRIGPWNEELLSWQDWEFHLRAVAINLKYERAGVPDCYWRVPQGDSIGGQSTSPRHLKSHEATIQSAANVLRENNRLDSGNKVLLARLWFWLAERWRRERQPAEALRVWNSVRTDLLVGDRAWKAVADYLSVPSGGKVRDAQRRLCRMRIPRELLFDWPATLRRLPPPPNIAKVGP